MLKNPKVILANLMIMSLMISNIVFAQSPIKVNLDGKIIDFDVVPQLIDGRTMVPLRKIFEAMGATVSWDDTAQSIEANTDVCSVKASINNTTLTVNGTPKTLDVPPMLIESRTLVPVRFVAEAFGATVDWNEKTSTVNIKSQKISSNVQNNGANALQNFTDGFEKADYTKATSKKYVKGSIIDAGSKLYLKCTINKTEVYGTDTSTGKAILGYITDDNNNNWLVLLHSTAVVNENEYDNIIGKSVILLGAYNGYSSTDEMPIITLYKLYVEQTGEIKIGLDTLLLEEDNNVASSSVPTKTIYTVDGKTINIPESEVEAYKKLCWYTEPVQIMYATDGRVSAVAQNKVESYKKDGWYLEPIVKMYAADGRTMYIEKSKVDEQKTVGWYLEPVCIMYAADGSTTIIDKSELEQYQQKGWYQYPVITVYATDGSSALINKEELSAYEEKGWNTECLPDASINVPYKNVGFGTVQGVITWQYNKFVGTKADVGAQVLLVPINHKPCAADANTLNSMKNYFDKSCYSTEVDGMGNYYLDNIPAGNYIIIIMSEATNQSPDYQKIYSDYVAKGSISIMFSKKGIENLLRNIRLNSSVFQNITVTAGQTVRYSNDFGNTYD